VTLWSSVALALVAALTLSESEGACRARLATASLRWALPLAAVFALPALALELHLRCSAGSYVQLSVAGGAYRPPIDRNISRRGSRTRAALAAAAAAVAASSLTSLVWRRERRPATAADRARRLAAKALAV